MGYGKDIEDLSSCFAKAKMRVVVFFGLRNQVGFWYCLFERFAELEEVVDIISKPAVQKKQALDSELSSCKKSVTPESSIQRLIKMSLKML